MAVNQSENRAKFNPQNPGQKLGLMNTEKPASQIRAQKPVATASTVSQAGLPQVFNQTAPLGLAGADWLAT